MRHRAGDDASTSDEEDVCWLQEGTPEDVRPRAGGYVGKQIPKVRTTRSQRGRVGSSHEALKPLSHPAREGQSQSKLQKSALEHKRGPQLVFPCRFCPETVPKVILLFSDG